ncbi:MAG: hypothetical protein C0614_00280, partial [Desulfuromonas sp.]
IILMAGTVTAGGVDPREQPAPEAVPQEKVTATPAQTAAAVKKARQAVAPNKVEEARVSRPQPKAVPAVAKTGWLLGTRATGCKPLSEVSRTVKNIGRFETPREFAQQMHQRGHQAFVLDIGDSRDRVLRIKVPDLEIDLTFSRAEMCR